jgi:hypothetical protein
MQQLPSKQPSQYLFGSWQYADRPTEEGVGLLPVASVDPEKVIACVLDVDHYVGNIGHVAECREIADSRYVRPLQVRFYQRIKIPLLGAIHHELVLSDLGLVGNYRVAAWTMLGNETAALEAKQAARSQFSDGAWLASPTCVGYAFSSAPRREDVGFLKWKALTKGADAGASAVLRSNIEGMVAWANRL